MPRTRNAAASANEASKEANTRLYVVEERDTGDGNTFVEHLVEASSGPQAIRIIAERRISSIVAKPKDIARLMTAGVKVQTANGAPQP